MTESKKPEPVATTAIADPILQQGEAPAAPPKVSSSLAGKYRLVHGTVTFGPEKKALPGAILSLSDEDAGPMLAVGVIEPLK